MNAERLLKHYERIAEAPDAIARLRRFILDLAVRGKLVPQDPNDEPASELLKRIAKEKARLVKEGIVKAERNPKAHSMPTEIFDLPKGWSWATLQAVCHSISDGDHQPPPKSETGVPFLVIGDIKNKTINYGAERKVPNEYFNGLDAIRKPKTGDLLYTLVGSFGIPVPVLSDQPFCIQRHIGIVRPSDSIDLKALAIFLESEFAFKQAETAATGIAQKTVSLAGLRSMLLPLPPLAEQHRIAAKVDELMGLCDRLEAARQAREATRDRLSAASLARLSAPDPETFQDDARFALNALPALTTRPDQIKRLRQTILNLAVRGKLVPQDASDEPASELLKRIAKEKARLVRDGKFKSFEGSLDREPSAFSFEVPGNWCWCYLDDIAAVARGGSPRPIEVFITTEPNGIPWIKIGDSQRGSVFIENTRERIKPEGLVKTRLVIPGDLLLSNSMSFGFPYITNVEGCIHDGWLVIRTPAGLLEKLYLHKVLLSDHAKAEFSEAAAGAVVQNLNADKARQLSIPLPPLAEQHRIVAKVDELMALCDRLEASLTVAVDTRRRLLDALLSEALTPEDVAELEAAE